VSEREEERPLRVAAVADLHCTRTGAAPLAPLFAQAAAQADVLLLGGDLTDYGLPEEAQALARTLDSLPIPVLAVLGNHDYESGREEEVKAILGDASVRVLDGDSVEVGGVGFAGCKGFCGGFGQKVLEPWGEPSIKRFVREAVDEALKLERALARLTTRQRVALLHYAPVVGTVRGEPPELHPFLGSSRLEEPLCRYRVAAAFHGHAHRGALEGRTSSGAPVYNVALPALRRERPDQPFRVVEIDRHPVADQRHGDRRAPMASLRET
jgi:Icc-related predicted phosphoesterase